MNGFVGAKSFKSRPIFGIALEVPCPSTWNRPEGMDPDDWVYSYSYNDLIGSGDDYDIVKVIELEDGDILERYFLINHLNMAIALARRTISKGSWVNCSTYIYSMDKLLTANRHPRAYAFKSQLGPDEYLKHLGDILTPVLPTYASTKTFRALTATSSDENIYWLDKVAIQGWFPVEILDSLYQLSLPIGWDIDASHLLDMSKDMSEERGLGIDDYSENLNVFREKAAEHLHTSPLLDFKAIVEVCLTDRREFRGETKSLIYYDPLSGKVIDLDTVEDREAKTNEYAMVNLMTEALMEALASDGVDASLIKTITIYRCLNDIVMFSINADDPDLPFDRVLMDYGKHLFVHYGLVQIPASALFSSKGKY